MNAAGGRYARAAHQKRAPQRPLVVHFGRDQPGDMTQNWPGELDRARANSRAERSSTSDAELDLDRPGLLVGRCGGCERRKRVGLVNPGEHVATLQDDPAGYGLIWRTVSEALNC